MKYLCVVFLYFNILEPVSDNNEDSTDSFKQKTPLGPSPLTIKQEPKEATNPSGDLKSNGVQKVYKCDSQSPSKMLKDKFLKEKGSEIQKIMCKMKQEGIVDSDSDENTHEEKKDEVDGIINDTDSVNTVKEEPKDSLVVNIVTKENVPEEGTAGNVIQTEENILDNDKNLDDNKSHIIGKNVEEEVPGKELSCEIEEGIGEKNDNEMKDNKKFNNSPLDIDEDNKDIEIFAKKLIKSDCDDNETEEPLSDTKMLEEKSIVEQTEPKITDSIKESEQGSGQGQAPNTYQVQNNLPEVKKKGMLFSVKSGDEVIDEDFEKETDSIESDISSVDELKTKDGSGLKEIHEKITEKGCESGVKSPNVDISFVTENRSACLSYKSTPNTELNKTSGNTPCEKNVVKETASGDRTDIECEAILKDTSNRTVNDNDEWNVDEKIINCEVITKEMKIENPEIVDEIEKSTDGCKVAIFDIANLQNESSAMKQSEKTDMNVKLINGRQSNGEEKSKEENVKTEESGDHKDADEMMKSVSETIEAPKKARKRKQDEITATPNSCTEDEEHLELPTKRNILNVVRKNQNSFANELIGINKTNECAKSDEIGDKNDINFEAESKSCKINFVEESENKNVNEKIGTADSVKENEESLNKCDESVKENEMEDSRQSDNIKPDDSIEKDEVIKESVKISTPTKIKGLVQIRKKCKAQKRQVLTLCNICKTCSTNLFTVR